MDIVEAERDERLYPGDKGALCQMRKKHAWYTLLDSQSGMPHRRWCTVCGIMHQDYMADLYAIMEGRFK